MNSGITRERASVPTRNTGISVRDLVQLRERPASNLAVHVTEVDLAFPWVDEAPPVRLDASGREVKRAHDVNT